MRLPSGRFAFVLIAGAFLAAPVLFARADSPELGGVPVGQYGVSCRLNGGGLGPPSYRASDAGKSGVPTLTIDQQALLHRIQNVEGADGNPTYRHLWFAFLPEFVVFEASGYAGEIEPCVYDPLGYQVLSDWGDNYYESGERVTLTAYCCRSEPRPWLTPSPSPSPPDCAALHHSQTSDPRGSGVWTFRAIFDFQGDVRCTGSTPSAVVRAPDGALYGTTGDGGLYGQGTIFRLDAIHDGFHQTVVYNFKGEEDGGHPTGPLTLGNDGALYGTTHTVSSESLPQGVERTQFGTVFALTKSGSAYRERVLWHFKGNPDGEDPTSVLFVDRSDAIYGVTLFGGSAGHGTVFKLTSSESHVSERILFDFGTDDSKGRNPDFIAPDKGGAILGVASTRGGSGIIFALDPHGGEYRERRLYLFSGGTDGQVPIGITRGEDGALYGVTNDGGTAGHGTIYRLDKSERGYVKTILYAFQGRSDGCNPNTALIAVHGSLYGAAGNNGCEPYGGAHVFRLTGSNFTMLFWLKYGGENEALTGLSAYGGTLYGATRGGGNPSNGIVFSLAP